MENQKILFLTIKKEFFDQIKSGQKTSEFREYKKHWIQKLMNKDGSFKTYDLVLFQNGYHANVPRMWVEFKRTKINRKRTGLSYWDNVFEIKLGEIIKTENV
jgi:hypothetical protein